MTRDEAREQLRALLGPFRDRAVEVFEVPDIQDAIHVHGSYRDLPSYDELVAMVETAGWDLLWPLVYVFEEDE